MPDEKKQSLNAPTSVNSAAKSAPASADAKGKDKKPEDAKAEKPKKPKKPNIFKRAGTFLKNCVIELKKVTWLSPQNTVRYSALVIVAIVLIAAVIGAFDYLCAWVINSLGMLY